MHNNNVINLRCVFVSDENTRKHRYITYHHRQRAFSYRQELLFDNDNPTFDRISCLMCGFNAIFCVYHAP